MSKLKKGQTLYYLKYDKGVGTEIASVDITKVGIKYVYIIGDYGREVAFDQVTLKRTGDYFSRTNPVSQLYRTAEEAHEHLERMLATTMLDWHMINSRWNVAQKMSVADIQAIVAVFEKYNPYKKGK